MVRVTRGSLNPGRPWLKSTECQWCGFYFTVNNNEDRKIRIKKYRGRVICPTCQQTFVRVLAEYDSVFESLERIGCLKRLVKKGKITGKFTKDCKCPSCVAHTLLDRQRTTQSDGYGPHAPLPTRRIYGLRAREDDIRGLLEEGFLKKGRWPIR